MADSGWVGSACSCEWRRRAYGMPVRRGLAVALLVLALSGCLPDFFESLAEPAALVVMPGGASVVAGGGTQSFSATLRSRDGSITAARGVRWASLNPTVATIDNLNGVATAVASGQATIQAATERDTGYALLTVAIPGAGAVTQWTAQTLPSVPGGGQVEDLYAVWGTSSQDVYAAGIFGRIVRYTGSTWALLPTGSTSVNHRALWGTSASDIYAVGGDILHFDGATWQGTGPGSFYDVWGSSPRDVFVVGENGIVLHFDGRGWSELNLGAATTGDPLYGIWGTSAGNVFAVGGTGQTVILRFDGRSWVRMTTGASVAIRDVWGTSPADVYAVTFNGSVLRFDGAMWTEIASFVDFFASAIWGTSPSDIFVVGARPGGGDRIFHFDGNGWTETTTGTGFNPAGVWGTMTDVFIAGYYVGTRGAVFRGTR